LRQTVVDIMQLVREIQVGHRRRRKRSGDLNASRISYAGQSFGGIYGTQLQGLEPEIRAGVENVPGGPISRIARPEPSFRPLVGISLITRTPSLYNVLPPDASLTNFNENMPLRNLPIVTTRFQALPRSRSDRPRRVGAASRQPGCICALHHSTGAHPVRTRATRPSRTRRLGDPPCVRL
jgi:hypothetical protein